MGNSTPPSRSLFSPLKDSRRALGPAPEEFVLRRCAICGLRTQKAECYDAFCILVSFCLSDVEAPDVYRGRKQGYSAYTAHKAASSRLLSNVDVDAAMAQIPARIARGSRLGQVVVSGVGGGGAKGPGQ